MTLEVTEKEMKIIEAYRTFEETAKMFHEQFIAKDFIKEKLRELDEEHNNFRDMVFNVPTKVERDFIAYMTLKEILKDD